MVDTPLPESASAAERIHRAGGRATDARKRILQLLLESGHTLSHADVEEAVRARGLEPDRVTVYRALEWLVEKGLAHKVAGVDRVWRFGAVSADPHEHAHFHCSDCGQVYCIEDLPPVTTPALPPGFRAQRVELAIEGSCPSCDKRRTRPRRADRPTTRR